jgi:phosphoserine phosphatase
VSPFRSLILDVDSTLTGIEGIDWLAAQRGADVAGEIAALTSKAMDGAVPIDTLYGRRLDLVRPARSEIEALGRQYRERVAPGAHDAIARLRKAGIVMHLVSGGIREAILPFAEWLGFGVGELHAVGITFDPSGRYAGWDTASPLATAGGKAVVARGLGLPPPTLAVGDGVTDLALRATGATFAAFTGFVRRDAVVAGADHLLDSFDQLPSLVMS